MKSLYYFKSANALFFVICFLGTMLAKAQVGRYPTQAEINLKLELQQRYLSHSFQKAISSHLLTTGPEQNCMNAITVCQQTYSQTNSYTGAGSIQEVSGTCLTTQETNAVWYVFTAQNAGTFTFLLNTTNDYDYALYDITSIGCGGIPTAAPVRCNFSATYGSTGLVLPATAGSLSYNASQPPTMDAINVTAGQTFALIIDNFSANANGYTLTFGGTAQIFDNNPPTLAIASAICGGGAVNVNFSEFIACSSIASNGSDFSILGPASLNVPVTGVITGPCSSGASSTNSVAINFNSAGLPSGIYTITVNAGSDGNTVLDQCTNAMSLSQSVTFTYLGALTISATNTIVCIGGSSTLSVTTAGNPSGLSYAWTPISNSIDNLTVSPIADVTYIASVTYGGCTLSIPQLVVVGLPPIVSVNPANVFLCSGTSNITATSIMGSSACLSCNYTWSGSSTQVNNNVASSTVSGVGAGSYSVTVTSNNGCIGNTAVSNISIVSPSLPPSCNIIYASPSGVGTGLIPTSPIDIQTAVSMAACNNVVIKMEIGDYTINAPLNIAGFTTIEGGYDVGFTTKTSAKGTTGGFPIQGTRIIRSALGVEGSLGNFRYTAIDVPASSSYFRLQDLRIEMPDNAAGSGISNYGIYLASGCNNYNITRCYIYSGNAGSGVNGVAGTPNGLNGANGGNGSAGNNDEQESAGAGGGGGGGAGTTLGVNGNNATGNFASANGCGQTGGNGGLGGATGGNGGKGSNDATGCGCCGNGIVGVAGAISTDMRSGGGGGGGGSGGEENGTAGSGGAGGGVLSTYVANTTGGIGGTENNNGTSGASGLAGVTGSLGIVGGVGSDASGYWILGSNGGNGGPGSGGQGGKGGGGGGGEGGTFVIDGSGSGGGGGGGGGQGGVGGTGGTGGGSTYGIFIFNNGVNGTVADCQIVNGLAGAGGIGGIGSSGGTGGLAGLGSPYTGGEIGRGGNGGAGGAGGAGGMGGAGSSGVAMSLHLVGGLPMALSTSKNMLLESLITVDNKACTNVSMVHATGVSSPVWSNFDSGSSPSSGTGSPVNTAYSTLGRKSIIMNSDTYTDFNNIIVNPPSVGNIVSSANVICPGTTNFASSAFGTAGFNYTWSVLPLGANVLSPNAGNTFINFTNTTGAPINYTVTLTINSNCCGLMPLVTYTIDVNPSPTTPIGIVNSSCLGGVATFSATSPSGASFVWYSDAAGTILLGSGDSYSLTNVSVPITTYLQATNSFACTTTLTPVVMNPTTISPPTAVPSFSLSCDTGPVQVGINPVAGATSYSWYSDATGTTLIQSGTALDYIQTISTAGGSYTVYVQTNVLGCTSSVLVPITASVSTTPITLTSTITPNDTVCSNFPITFDLTAGGGDGSFTYSWSPFTSTISNPTYSFATSTSVYVDISSNGCTKRFLIPMIIANLAPPPLTATINNIPCMGTFATMDAASTSTNSISYSWYGPNSTSILSGSNTANATASDIGSYTVVALDAATGCSNTATGNLNQGIIAVSFIANPTNGAAPLPVSFTDQTIGGSTFTWNFGDGNSLPTSLVSFNPSNVFVTEGTYTVSLIVTEGVCQDTAYAVIVVTKSFDYSSVPNMFTPNADGKNDFFVAPGLEKFENNTVEIYNRWGTLVYQKKSYKNDWDGKANVLGTEKGLLPSATYFIVIDLGDVKNPPYHGYIEMKY